MVTQAIENDAHGPTAGSIVWHHVGVAVAFVCLALFTVLGAGFTVALGPDGLANATPRQTAVREAALRVSGGNIRRGREAIRAFGCRSCHVVPGMARLSPRSVGPTLEGFGDRMLIAGVLPNRLDNLVVWLQDPPRFAPRSAMPDMGIDQQTAADIAAYLYRH